MTDLSHCEAAQPFLSLRGGVAPEAISMHRDRHAPSGLAMTDKAVIARPVGPRQSSAAEVLERKTIAGRFRRPFLVENHIEVVVVVLVAVQEPNHIRLCPEKDVPVKPAEGECVPALPARLDPFRPVGNPLPERPKRLRDLHGNRLALVVALRLKVGTLPVPQRLDRKAVSRRPRQIHQNPSETRNRKLRKVASNFHHLSFPSRCNLCRSRWATGTTRMLQMARKTTTENNA